MLDFYEKLTSQTHIGLDGAVTYRTKPGLHGAIIVERPGVPDQRVFLLKEESSGRMIILNMETREEQKTFIYADNCCAEEFHHRIFLITQSTVI